MVFLKTHWNDVGWFVCRFLGNFLWCLFNYSWLRFRLYFYGLNFFLLHFFWFFYFVLCCCDVVLIHSIVFFSLIICLFLSPVEFSFRFRLLFWWWFLIWGWNDVDFKLWRFWSHFVDLLFWYASFQQKRHTWEESRTGVKEDLSKHLHGYVLSFRDFSTVLSGWA